QHIHGVDEAELRTFGEQRLRYAPRDRAVVRHAEDERGLAIEVSHAERVKGKREKGKGTAKAAVLTTRVSESPVVSCANCRGNGWLSPLDANRGGRSPPLGLSALLARSHCSTSPAKAPPVAGRRRADREGRGPSHRCVHRGWRHG